MQEKTTGRKKYAGARSNVILNERTEDMLNEIQEYIGATSTSETIRFLIQNFYNEKFEGKFTKNKP